MKLGALVAVVGGLVGIAVAGDQWVDRKQERAQRPVAEILEQIQTRQERDGAAIEENTEYRIRHEERERLRREGWQPPPDPSGERRQHEGGHE